MPILDRYVAKEILLPFLAGLLFLTQLLLATQVLAQADVLFGSGVSFVDIFWIVAALVPNVLGYVLVGIVAVWGVVCATTLRFDQPPGALFTVVPISDWRVLSGATVMPRTPHTKSFISGDQIARLYADA